MDQTGGAKIAEGSFGCVFIPKLKCSTASKEQVLTKNTEIAHTKVIDKLIVASEAEFEFSIAKMIHTLPLWKQYFIVADSMCTPAPIQNQTDPTIKDCAVIDPHHLEALKLLRMSYGGVSLKSYRMNFNRYSFLDFIKHLLEGAAILTIYGIIHFDLHPGNILVDSANIPRIIDFNLSVYIKKPFNKDSIRLSTYMPQLMQISPDDSIVKATWKYGDGQRGINDAFSHSKKYLDVMRIIRSVTGVTEREQLREAKAFMNTPLGQSGDVEAWFKRYWRVQDSWALGGTIIWLIGQMSLWPSFNQGEYATYSTTLIPILRKMCAVNPAKRIDTVQALAELDPDNYIVKTYGKAWLTKLASASAAFRPV